MRLIDADAFRDEWLENGENEYVYDTNSVLDSIDLQPTIDAEPVRHGRWIPQVFHEKLIGGKCSECGKFKRSNNMGILQKSYKRCHRCGAKMDLPHPTNEEKEAP